MNFYKIGIHLIFIYLSKKTNHSTHSDIINIYRKSYLHSIMKIMGNH